MKKEEPSIENIKDTATAAIAAASRTPFKTAFKITIGIALAQFTVLFLFVALAMGGCASVLYVLAKSVEVTK